MKVVGIDPAPGFGGHVFDGITKGRAERCAHEALRERLDLLEREESVLICWDAPLTGPANPEETTGADGAFTQRLIEKFFPRERPPGDAVQTGKDKQGRWPVPPGISVQGYAGCQHWTITRHMLGLPRVGRWDATWDKLPFNLLTTNPAPKSRRHVVEVHPALALWLWFREGERQWSGPWNYKKDRNVLLGLWKLLCDEVEPHQDLARILRNPGEPRDDDDLDARVAWLLGELWIRDAGVSLMGDRKAGAFLVPTLPRLEDDFGQFMSAGSESETDADAIST